MKKPMSINKACNTIISEGVKGVHLWFDDIKRSWEGKPKRKKRRKNNRANKQNKS